MGKQGRRPKQGVIILVNVTFHFSFLLELAMVLKEGGGGRRPNRNSGSRVKS